MCEQSSTEGAPSSQPRPSAWVSGAKGHPGGLKARFILFTMTESPAFARFAWQGGYGAFSVGPSTLEALNRYIDTQKEHHPSRTFQEEYRIFLKRYGVEYG
jgi:hypothetical protein